MSENQNTNTNDNNAAQNEENKKSFTDRVTEAAEKTKEWFDNHPVVKGALCGLGASFAVIGAFALLHKSE